MPLAKLIARKLKRIRLPIYALSVLDVGVLRVLFEYLLGPHIRKLTGLYYVDWYNQVVFLFLSPPFEAAREALL